MGYRRASVAAKPSGRGLRYASPKLGPRRATVVPHKLRELKGCTLPSAVTQTQAGSCAEELLAAEKAKEACSGLYSAAFPLPQVLFERYPA